MEMAEKGNLNWHTFSEHLQSMFKELYRYGRHSDVTLVSEDQAQFKAHKIVLSACSRVFKKIIENNPSQHPLIYLRGIHSFEMESILQVMYLGEGRIYHDRMREFVKVAKDLEVKDISDGLELPSEDAKEVVKENIPDEEIEEASTEETPIKTEKTAIKQKRMLNDNKSTQCSECGAEYIQKCNMLAHYRSKHEGGKYPCNLCHYRAKKLSNLQRHIQFVHEGFKYSCHKCDYQATKQSYLQSHILTKHSDSQTKYKNSKSDTSDLTCQF